MIRVQPTLKASRNKSPPYHKKAALLMAEIQRSPAEVGSLSHLFSGIYRYYIYIYISQVVSQISSINRIKCSSYWPGFWAPPVKAWIFCTPFGLGCIGRLIAKTTGQFFAGESLPSQDLIFPWRGRRRGNISKKIAIPQMVL